MKNKLKFLIKTSLNRKIKTKWFLIANIIFAIVIIGLFNIDTIISAFGGSFNEQQIIYVTDNTNKTYNILKAQNDAYKKLTDSKETTFSIKSSKKNPKQLLKQKKDAWVLVIDNDNTNYIKARLISEGNISSVDYAQLTSMMNNVKSTIALNESQIDQAKLAKISAPIQIKRSILDKNKKTDSENMDMIMSTVFPILILPCFILIVFLIQMIGAEINDEKTTKSMEIIISNVSPKVHFFSKIIASNLFVLIQGTLLILFAGVGIFIRKFSGNGSILNIQGLDIGSTIQTILKSNMASKFIYIIPLALILMILTFIAYSLLAGILASMTTNNEDYQQLQTPIIIVSLIGYYLSIMAGLFEGSTFIKVLSFVPFISAILAPSLLVLGQIGITEFIIAIILIIITIYLLIKYGLRVYKVGILNYSSKDLWKKMFKALKNNQKV
jgi:ABC-2 type transport system permease protein